MSGKIAIKQIITETKMNEKFVKEGMKRLGFKYDKDLCGLGKDFGGKHYKGGYEGFSLREDIPEPFSEL